MSIFMPINPFFCFIFTAGISAAFIIVTVKLIKKNRAAKRYSYGKKKSFQSMLPYLGIIVFAYVFLFHGMVCSWQNIDLKNNADKIIELSERDFPFWKSARYYDVQLTVLQAEYQDGESIAEYETYFIPDNRLLGNFYKKHLVSEIEKDGYKIAVNPLIGQTLFGLLRTGMYLSKIFVFSEDRYSVIEIDVPMKFILLQPLMMTQPRMNDLSQILSGQIIQA